MQNKKLQSIIGTILNFLNSEDKEKDILLIEENEFNKNLITYLEQIGNTQIALKELNTELSPFLKDDSEKLNLWYSFKKGNWVVNIYNINIVRNTFNVSNIDISNIDFISDNHTRLENGNIIGNSGANVMRGIQIRSADSQTYYVSIHNLDGIHPVWGNNIQMSQKQMKIITDREDLICLRGFGSDLLGNTFSDYGINISLESNKIISITLLMYDRNIEIVYKKDF